jgi:hypothetical protein
VRFGKWASYPSFLVSGIRYGRLPQECDELLSQETCVNLRTVVTFPVYLSNEHIETFETP